MLAARGIKEPGEICQEMCDMPGADTGEAGRASSLLSELVKKKKRWCVLGNYDADGMCATSLATLALESLEIKPTWLLTHRDHDHRSVDPTLVKRAKDEGSDILLIVDGGTNAVEGIKLAKELGMTVVVTDHHPADDKLCCMADAVVNPQMEGSGLPANFMCGTAVTLVLVREIYRRLGTRKRASRFVDLAAIATMSDLMPMDDLYNRSLVMAGIDLIRKGRCRPVIKAILRDRHSSCCPSDLNIRIGPLLNSAHRTAHAEIGVDALLAEDISAARYLADDLDNLNRERRLQSARILEESASMMLGASGNGAVIFKESWNINYLGLVASKLADKLGMPVVLLGSHNNETRGSARSVHGICLLQVLDAIREKEPGLLGVSGGHPYAAVVRIKGDIALFEKMFNKYCGKFATNKTTCDVMIDGRPTADELCDGSLSQLNKIPWGQDEFPKPRFVGEFKVMACMPARRANGYIHELSLDGVVFRAYNRTKLGEPGTMRSLCYSVSADNFCCDKPFIHPIATYQ